MRALSPVRIGIALAVLTTLVAAGAAQLGCRAILGIEERELVDGGTGGGTGDAGLALTCEDYCTAITATCTGDKAQYGSKQVCLGLCSTFTSGTLGDTMTDTLGCRINVLASSSVVEPADCAAAGPGGNGTCGSNCAAYCHSTLQICPQDFESPDDCTNACALLISCGTFYVGQNTPDNPSIQCRLFHISVAAEDGVPSDGGMTPAQVTHCPHAMGSGMCVVPDAGPGDCDAGVGP